MKKISVFNYISLDGFFAGTDGEIDWFYNHPKDEEWENYSQSAAGITRTLMYGRTTYEMMKSYWPTEEAIENYPEMANAINNNPKIVLSKMLKEPDEKENLRDGRQTWKNVTILQDINREEILKLKEKDDIVILGSGSIIQQLANLDLIDEYLVAVVPVILGKGKSFFKDVKKSNLHLNEAKQFKNGIVMLNYKSV